MKNHLRKFDYRNKFCRLRREKYTDDFTSYRFCHAVRSCLIYACADARRRNGE